MALVPPSTIFNSAAVESTAASFDKGGVALNDAFSKAEDALIAEIESQYGTGAKEIKASPATKKRIRRDLGIRSDKRPLQES